MACGFWWRFVYRLIKRSKATDGLFCPPQNWRTYGCLIYRDTCCEDAFTNKWLKSWFLSWLSWIRSRKIDDSICRHSDYSDSVMYFFATRKHFAYNLSIWELLSGIHYRCNPTVFSPMETYNPRVLSGIWHCMFFHACKWTRSCHRWNMCVMMAGRLSAHGTQRWSHSCSAY